MAELLRNKSQLILFKAETTYGVDSTPTGANVMMVSNISINPIIEKAARSNITGFFGASGAITVGQHVEVTFDMELSTSGTAGTAPAYDALLLAAGHAKVVTAGTSVVYSPVDSAFGSATIYWRNGIIQHALTGCRGSVEFSLDSAKAPMAKFKFIGLWNDPQTGVAAPTGVSFAAFTSPLGASKATSTFTYYGVAVEMSALSINPGIKVEYIPLIGTESVEIISRDGNVKTKFRTNDAQYTTMIANAKNNTFGAVAFNLGTVAGSRVGFSVPNVQIKASPNLSWDKELAYFDIDASIVPTARNNDYTISFT